jgi:hypothetical protein
MDPREVRIPIEFEGYPEVVFSVDEEHPGAIYIDATLVGRPFRMPIWAFREILRDLGVEPSDA